MFPPPPASAAIRGEREKGEGMRDRERGQEKHCNI